MVLLGAVIIQLRCASPRSPRLKKVNQKKFRFSKNAFLTIAAEEGSPGSDSRKSCPKLLRQKSMKQIYRLLQTFFRKCGRPLRGFGTVLDKTWDECQFLLGIVRSSHVFRGTVTRFRGIHPRSSSMPPRILLDGSSKDLEIRGPIEVAFRFKRGSNKEAY
jgi:hypothetical protein